jgi:hypothetical protein
LLVTGAAVFTVKVALPPLRTLVGETERCTAVLKDGVGVGVMVAVGVGVAVGTGVGVAVALGVGVGVGEPLDAPYID